MAHLKQYRMLIVLFVLSLIIRLAFWALVTHNNAAEAGDAIAYFYSAVGFRNILSDLLRASLPSYEDLARAYTSHWPPLQSFLLSLGFLAFGSNLAVGRLMMAVLSALTTPLVYLVASNFSDRRVALVAPVIFAIYPTFIHYSLRLFSETTFILILFLMLHFALMTVKPTQPHEKVVLFAVITGCLLGLGTLTRAVGLLWIPTVALWVAWRCVQFKRRLLLPAIILISAGITLLPWEILLFAVEGRAVLITTSSDVTLYLGNNPLLPEGHGGSGHVPNVTEAASEYSEQHRISLHQAYRALALQEITGDPAKFVRRGFHKLRATWSADFQLFKSILSVVYPPLSNGLVGLIFTVVLVSHFAFLALVMWGLWSPAPALRHRELLMILVLTAMMTHFVTVGHSRLNVPLLALLVPAAGHGLAHFRVFGKKSQRRWALATLVSVAIVWFSICTSLPIEYSRLIPSSHYLSLVTQLDRWLGTESTVSDRLLFKRVGNNYPAEVTISIIGRDFEFAEVGSQIYNWKPSAEAEFLNLVLQSQTATQPVQVQLSSGQSKQSTVASLNKEAWQTWRPSTLPGIQYMWVGSSQFPISAFQMSRAIQ